MNKIELEYMKGRLKHGWPPIPPGTQLVCKGMPRDKLVAFAYIFNPVLTGGEWQGPYALQNLQPETFVAENIHETD